MILIYIYYIYFIEYFTNYLLLISTMKFFIFFIWSILIFNFISIKDTKFIKYFKIDWSNTTLFLVIYNIYILYIYLLKIIKYLFFNWNFISNININIFIFKWINFNFFIMNIKNSFIKYIYNLINTKCIWCTIILIILLYLILTIKFKMITFYKQIKLLPLFLIRYYYFFNILIYLYWIIYYYILFLIIYNYFFFFAMNTLSFIMDFAEPANEKFFGIIYLFFELISISILIVLIIIYVFIYIYYYFSNNYILKIEFEFFNNYYQKYPWLYEKYNIFNKTINSSFFFWKTPIIFSKNIEALLEILFLIIPTIIIIYILIPTLGYLYTYELWNIEYDIWFRLDIIGNQWYWTYYYKIEKLDYIYLFDNKMFIYNEIDYNNFEYLEFIIESRMNFDNIENYYFLYNNNLVVFQKIKLINYEFIKNSFIYFNNLLTIDNSLLFPKECNSLLSLTSLDVIHSWSIVSLGIKIDAVPGRLSYGILVSNYINTLMGQCSELCGIFHSFMPILIDIISHKEYTIWISCISYQYIFKELMELTLYTRINYFIFLIFILILIIFILSYKILIIKTKITYIDFIQKCKKIKKLILYILNILFKLIYILVLALLSSYLGNIDIVFSAIENIQENLETKEQESSIFETNKEDKTWYKQLLIVGLVSSCFLVGTLVYLHTLDPTFFSTVAECSQEPHIGVLLTPDETDHIHVTLIAFEKGIKGNGLFFFGNDSV